MSALLANYVWKRRTHRGVTAAMVEPQFWAEGDADDGNFAVAPKIATELAARAASELERAPRAPSPAPRPAPRRAAPEPAPSRLDALLADYKATIARDERKADMAAAVEAGVTRALRLTKKTDPFRDDPSHLDPDDDDDDPDEEDDEEDDEKHSAPSRRQREESAQYIRAGAGIAERPRFQIGSNVSARPDPNWIAGHVDGSRPMMSWQAPMPTNAPPGRSPLHDANRTGRK